MNALKRLNIQKSLEHEIALIFARARGLRCTHAELLELRQKHLFGSRLWQDVGPKARGELLAYWNGYKRCFEYNHVEWCHYLDGAYVSMADARERIAEVDSNLSAYVWKGTQCVY